MSEHSNVVGGSTARKRRYCPLSYQLEKSVPKPPPSEFADRGSMLHAAMELILTAAPTTNQEIDKLMDDLEGQDLGYKGHEITAELIDTKLMPALESWFKLHRKYKFVDYWIEQRVSLEELIDGAFGTADFVAIDEESRVHVLDWKFGDGVPVPVEQNDGMAFYGGGVLNDMEPEMVDLRKLLDGLYGDDPIQFVFHIVQPRAGHTDDDPLQSWETDEDWINDFLDSLIAAMDLALKPDPQPKTGDWCKWCNAKAVCPAQTQLVSESMTREPEMMSGLELAKCLDMADHVKAWADEIYKVALRELESGAAVPGYKLVQKRASRKWINEEEVIDQCKRSKVKVDNMYNKVLKSPAQMEKSAKTVFAKKLKPMVHSISSGLTIAPDSDKRSAVSATAAIFAESLEITQQ